MERTSIMLPQELKIKASRLASQKGVSLGQLIRESLEQTIKTDRQGQATNDPLFLDDAVFEGDIPADLSKNHDDFLY
ncbi:MAG: hypothetical protein GY866_20350 [Proteobacteria bacterium]|nr:hypothetical protein [Pseudomonadota bacterium]